MSKEVKITKDMILEAAFEIAREKGLEEVSNRSIAKRLECSIRPIYYQFNNSDELKKELYNKIEKYFYKHIMDNMIDNIPYYRQVGINYIKFAREEKNFFKILFMSKSDYLPEGFVSKSEDDFKEISKLIKMSTKLNDGDIKSFHIKMWMFTHGIATLLATDTILLTEEQISNLLSSQFQALMLLEENPDNKWILDKNKDWRKNDE